MSRMIPQYDTKLFTQIWDEATDFVYDYKHVGIPTTISDANATTLFYLLYARYGNSPIANYDETQFKYKIFSVIFQYGPTWEKRLSVQQTLRDMQLSDLIDNGALNELFSHTASNNTTKSGTDNNYRTYQESGTNTGTVGVASMGNTSNTHNNTVNTDNETENVENHAYNPSSAPAADAYTALGYINEQVATKNTLDGTVQQSETNEGTTSNSTTTTNNLADAKSGNVSDARTIADSVAGQEASNNSTTTTMTAGKLKAYEKLLELLESDVTGEFISKFKICFKQFVMPERTWIYVSEVDDDDEE